ncbi:trace amine-associated receptor 13c-like [Latimeria chalumnae]|uniref:trace amine-associated receptor 13c-like n=1 Tax=Latimeria chalumnae TaxID=7897 RepID=UPI0003C1A39B|nr:PREDICTED: trace amine-associated receptor 13c-like [Latimeria chalumnae]|eukprot:XP_006013067.1 PREDICTED: trace amine-associated receptor 13c-like [Latimeria chalumnae]
MNNPPIHSMSTVEFCFEHVNESCIKTARSIGVKTTLYLVLVLTMLITVSGNLMVIISISHFKQLHTPNNMLVHSLAVADFLLGLSVFPFSMLRTIETCWYFGELFCKLHSSVDMLLCTASIFHLCFIAVDRYYAVCHPLHYTTKITIPVAWMLIAAGWLLPGIYTFGLMYTGANDEGLKDFVASISCVGGCFLLFNKLWGLLDALIFYVPYFIMTGLYARIFSVARRQLRKIQNTEGKCNPMEEKRTKATRSREQKAAKTLAIVMGVFLFCWVPYFTDTMVDAYINFATPTIVFETLIWLGYFNSAFNPLIYAFFYPWFRKAFKVIITGKIFSPNSSIIQLYNE